MVEYVNNKKEPSSEQFDVCDNNVLLTKIIENNVEHLSNKELIDLAINCTYLGDILKKIIYIILWILPFGLGTLGYCVENENVINSP